MHVAQKRGVQRNRGGRAFEAAEAPAVGCTQQDRRSGLNAKSDGGLSLAKSPCHAWSIPSGQSFPRVENAGAGGLALVDFTMKTNGRVSEKFTTERAEM